VRDIIVYKLNSFGVTADGGNPAGVVLDADELTDDQKLNIAAEVGFSETAFVEQSDKADFKVRFFTPTKEVGLCGHATIAVYALLFQKNLLSVGTYTQELHAGILDIEIQDTGFVWMDQTLPQFSEILTSEDVNACINIVPSYDDLKPQIVSTGLRDILLPLHTREELDALVIDPAKLSDLNQKTNTVGLHAFVLSNEGDEYVAYTRNFAPLYGISEESATGSSNGALAAYLFTYGKLNNVQLSNLRFEQGRSMGQPSEIFVTLSVLDKEVQRVQVGGTAIITGEIRIVV
jgi:PhzF family phenazine biosynthesis protein